MMMMEREIKGKEMVRRIRYYFIVKVGEKSRPKGNARKQWRK